MKLSKVCAIGVLSLFAFTAVACGGGGEGDDDDDTMMTNHTVADAKAASKYVINSINIPDKAAENDALGFDLDQDSRRSVDNKLGSILQLIASNAGSTSVDLQAQVDEQVMMGKIILLASYKGMTGAAATESDTVFQLFLGKDGDMDATNNFGGAGVFTIDSAGPTDAKFYGKIAAGKFTSTEKGSARLKLSIVEGDPVDINIIGGKVEGTVTDTGIMNAKIGGGITKKELETNVLPLVYNLIVDQIMKDPTSNGAMALKQLFDTNKDGMITRVEFDASNTIMTVLSPDVDLLIGDGSTGITYGKDGTKESVSLGLGLTAVKGSF